MNCPYDATMIDGNELHLSEDPAVELLQSLGYAFVPSETLDAERSSLREVVLSGRLEQAIKRLNPWISDENLKKAAREITTVQSVSLMDASEKVHAHLVHTLSLEQDIGQGKKGQSVHFIDFDRPENNEFIVTRQFRVLGSRKEIVPDLVVFVNGMPLVVIECKSPTIQDPEEKAVTQLIRYQELEDRFREQGAPRLFETVQVLAGICGQAGVYGTVGTQGRYYAEWKAPYPLTLDELQKVLGRIPTPQDVLLAGLLQKRNLLEMIRTFVAFEVEQGRTVRKLARYQQFIAVNRAVDRIVSARKSENRGGVIWHTQGSGKSLTMLWLAIKLRRVMELENPVIVIVTDRVDLDTQISGTFNRCGFPNPEQARSVTDLRRLLTGTIGKTIMTTVQKFQEATDDLHPVLSDARNLFVMVDEAHRSQYRNLAANMRQAMPNACFLGFTGTPIDKKDRSTLRTFGPYIHTYTIEQAVQDRATVPIYYESRLPDVVIEGESLDALFERMFREYQPEDRERIKGKYATAEALACVPKRIERICLDIIEHYEQFIHPNGFKAQVVAVSRDAAVTYKETLDRLGAPESALIMSAMHNDPERLARYHLSKEQQQGLIERFKKRDDPLSLLVVCDMLITGFDAPVEQVMYLDSPFREHTLLQAIARVNRVADGKDYGLVVDYWGVSRFLQDALSIFQPQDIQGIMQPKTDELPRLESRHRSAMRFFDRVERADLEACVRILEQEDARTEFDVAFRRFSQSMDMLLPDPAALLYASDLKWLGKVRSAARTRFRDARLDLSGCGEKVRRLIDEHVRVVGIERLLEPVSIFSDRFDEEVAKLTSDEARASEMEHAIRHEISVRVDEDPVFYRTLRERLESIILERRQDRIDSARQLQLLQSLKTDLRDVRRTAEDMGLSETALAFYHLLSTPQTGASDRVGEERAPYEESGESLKELSGLIFESLEKLVVIDWIHKEDVQREMRRLIKRHLRAAGYGSDATEALTMKLMDIARVRLGR